MVVLVLKSNASVKAIVFLVGFINPLEIKMLFLLIKRQKIKRFHTEFYISISKVGGRCMQVFQIL